jgi:hypothetical protein
MEIMNFFNSTSANQDISIFYSDEAALANHYQKGLTAVPRAFTYVQEGEKYIAVPPVLYLPMILNIPIQYVLNIDQGDGIFGSFLSDAINRYKDLYHGSDLDTTKADKFLSAIKSLYIKTGFQPYIIFNKFSVKVQLKADNKEFVLDCDYEDPDSVFMLSKEDTLIVKECTLDKIEETLRSF